LLLQSLTLHLLTAPPQSETEQPYEEFDEPDEPEVYEEPQGEGGDGNAGGTEDPDARRPTQEAHGNIVIGGDPSAAAAANTAAKSRNTVSSLKAKKIPNDKRTTTPYMTKYERARVLGTRALQIRSLHGL
jgi:DNA-directed RNA polymerases I, II, and III subunit RPABC2